MKKSILLIVISVILSFGCKKEEYEVKMQENEPKIQENFILKPYMKNLIAGDSLAPYTGDYYIHVSFKDQNSSASREMTFFRAVQNIALTSSQNADNTVLSYGQGLKDTVTREELEVAFYYNQKTDTTFTICYADYRFADPWKNVTGANILYWKPVESRPDAYYQYLGTNSNGSFFKITYFDKDRINGKFRTIWKECCGDSTVYSVSGDFSIPRLKYFKYIY